MATKSNGGDGPQGGIPSLVDSLEEYLKDIPKSKRADALHQVFYGFYTRVAVIDRATGSGSRSPLRHSPSMRLTSGPRATRRPRWPA